jgi:hypothetical protein
MVVSSASAAARNLVFELYLCLIFCYDKWFVYIFGNVSKNIYLKYLKIYNKLLL